MPKDRLWTAHALAKASGRSYNRITGLLADVEPAEETKRADGTVIRCYRLGDVFDALEGSQGLDLTQERALLAKAQRAKIDFDMKQRKRELIPAAWVEKPWNGMVGSMRSRLLELPARLVPLLQATDGSYAQMKPVIERELWDAMQDLSEFAIQVVEPKD